MTRIWHVPRALGRPARAYLRDTSGGVLVEFALVVSLFLFLFAALLDFGRLSYSGVTAQSAAQIAARLAIVRPGGLPRRSRPPPARHQHRAALRHVL